MKNRLVCGDLLKILPLYKKDSVDLVFGSPPYEDARNLKEDPFPVLKGQAWVDWMVQVYIESLRISRGLVAYVIQGRTRKFRWSATPCLLAADLHRAGVHLRDFIIYHRYGIPGSGGPDWLRHDCEYILCATNGGRLPWSDNTAMGNSPKFNPGGDPTHRKRDGKRVRISGMISGARRAMPHASHGGRSGVLNRNGTITRKCGKVYEPPKVANPGNLFHCSGGHLGSNFAHKTEAPFPESLAEFIIRSFCSPHGTVLDPFCGSGTSCAVAKRLGRSYIGIDIRRSQIELTKRRLAE